MPDRYIVVANYQHGTKIAADGAKAFVLWMTGSGESVEVVVRSRGGRWVQKYEQVKHLGNFRVRTLVEEGAPRPIVWDAASKTREAVESELLARCLAARAEVRTTDRDLGDEDARP